MGKLRGVLTFAIVALTLACQEQAAAPPQPTPISVQVTATPDIPAAVTAAPETSTDTPAPTATSVPVPTPNIEATMVARLAATVAATPANTPVATSTLTPTPTSTPTPTPSPTPTAVPTATPWPTHTPEPTRAPMPTFELWPTNTATPTPTPLAPLKFDQSFLFHGPLDGTLVHKPDDGTVEVEDGPVTLGDVLFEATFLNPNTADDRFWQHGFLLKNKDGHSQYLLFINSDGHWDWFHRLGGSRELGRYSEKSEDIDLSPGGKNLLQGVVIGDRGWVYINGNFQGEMDLSVDTGRDRVTISVSDYRLGETRFEDFTVFSYTTHSKAESNPGVDPTTAPLPALKFARS